MFKPDNSQLKALETWYPKDHPLHLEPLHPALGLAGEAGEILDQWKKHLYKPGYEVSREDFLDELGDLWYYLRILTFLSKVHLEFPEDFPSIYGAEQPLAEMNYQASIILCHCIKKRTADLDRFKIVYYCLEMRLAQLNCSLDELTILNYEKLRHGDNHGWKKAGTIVIRGTDETLEDYIERIRK